jgi:hypothetical protein
MTDAVRFEELTRGLAEGAERADGVVGLVLLGSASDEAAGRRDEWSDHDFFAIIAKGRGAELRQRLGWLPDQHRLVLTAREGEIGFVAVYDDGHVFEFAYSEAHELAGALADDATVVVDDADGTSASLIADARERAAQADRFDPVNDARLVLVKVLIGVGRARRGELLNAGEFVRIWAVRHLVRAIRGRYADASSSARDAIDPVRRFETDFPEWGARIAAVVASPVDDAARGLVAMLRDVLEPGWSAFPSRAADAVERRLGWMASDGGDVGRRVQREGDVSLVRRAHPAPGE